MLSHQLLQHIIDGKKAIIQNPTEAQRLALSSHPSFLVNLPRAFAAFICV